MWNQQYLPSNIKWSSEQCCDVLQPTADNRDRRSQMKDDDAQSGQGDNPRRRKRRSRRKQQKVKAGLKKRKSADQDLGRQRQSLFADHAKASTLPSRSLRFHSVTRL